MAVFAAMEAQEHYILVTTTIESRMILHRFSDAVHRTPDTQGMQSASLSLGCALSRERSCH